MGSGIDFNDMAAALGPGAVEKHISNQLADNPNNPKQDNQANNRFGFLPAATVISNMQPPEWLIKNVLEKDCLSVIWGEPGQGKTFVALDMALSIATGTSWHGNQSDKGTVFYIAGEGHNGLARRLSAWKISRGYDQHDIELYISKTPAMLDEPEGVSYVHRSITAICADTGAVPSLIVVDTLARNFSGDENSSRDMGSFISSLDHLRASWNATVLIIHHSGKDKQRGARGSIALKGAIDSEYAVSMDESKVILLENHKMKDGERPNSMFFSLDNVDLPLTDDDGNTVTSCVTRKLDGYTPAPILPAIGANQQKALSALQDLTEEHQSNIEASGNTNEARVHLDDWRKRCIGQGMVRQRFNEAFKSLQQKGLIKQREPYVYLVRTND